jgi:SAM-dependent methyltransferase
MRSESGDFARQQAYYRETAAQYDSAHLAGDPEHQVAMALLVGYVRQNGIRSILDIGSGTGRAVAVMKRAAPEVKIVGIEPSAELREIGYRQHGLSQDELIDGNALKIAYPNDSFDLVCEFATLHHIAEPGIAVAEMLRVARKAIFISDNNNFGQGSAASRRIKQTLNRLGLWRAFDRLRTGGKGSHWSEGDGLYYSYSVFNDLPAIRARCSTVHIVNTTGQSVDHYREATHVALLGIKS